jgi:MFS superfamily sulfate permease-like transporter
LRAGLIVFLIAVPLCLGIATASGAPPLAGLIAGFVGGTIVALLSGSELSVAGPAAGLTVIVLGGIEQLGFPAFLTAVVIAGVAQMAFGALGWGAFAQLVPHGVVRGMLAAIGLILILKQLPHAVGYDADYEGDQSFSQPDGQNTFSELITAADALHPGAIIVSLAAALAMLLWRDYGKVKLTRYCPRELMAVLAGLLTSEALVGGSFGLSESHLVNIPTAGGISGLASLWIAPAMSALSDPTMWKLALTIAIVASIESLLSVEACDRLDEKRRQTPLNRELMAQGAGNMTSGLLGGLPVTAVVVRSFTNIHAGGQSRWSAVFHGVLILTATLGLGAFLSRIPLATLAIVLLVVGYKLTPPKLYKQMWQQGREQFLPFLVTVLCVLFTDLLTGTLLGFAFAIFFVIYRHYSSSIVLTDDGNNRLIRLAGDVSFLHKAQLAKAIAGTRAGGALIVDGTRARDVDVEIQELLSEVEAEQSSRNYEVRLLRSNGALHPFFRAAESPSA